jgi:hypothetical protein
MKIRNTFLFFSGVILLTMAPAAMAQVECMRCQLTTPPKCVRAFHAFGNLGCVVDETGCHLFDEECGGPNAATSFASDFTVVSVERTEEPQQPAPSAQRVALATKPTAIPAVR